MRVDGAQSVDRAIALLLRIVDDGGQASLAELARDLGLPSATAYRLANSLRQAGLVVALGKGRYHVGPALASRQGQLSLRSALVAAARPILRRLARAGTGVAHIGVLENDMVTYLVREGAEANTIFSEEDKQLEAYCSGIGKMLLASLPEEGREAYLAAGPFVPLTERTITSRTNLRDELAVIAAQGFARDTGEAALEINCLAVGIRHPCGASAAALSLSRTAAPLELDHGLALLHAARDELEAVLFNCSGI